MNTIFQQKHASWKSVEKAIEGLSTNKNKGDAFEEFVHFYFTYHTALYQISTLHCHIAEGGRFPANVLKKLRLEKKDHGVDGVYVTHLGQWIAFQAKFRTNRQPLTYEELSTFWTEAEYADGRLIITNSKSLPKLAGKKSGHNAILCDTLDDLDDRFFTALYEYAQGKTKTVHRKIKTPRPYQQNILAELLAGLEQNSRGKLIAACGIGKTLLALWLVERRKDSTVLFLAPSLQLIRQTLGEWADEAAEPFEYLCVCSDQTVDLEDEAQLATSEIDVPVTTDSSTIRTFIQGKALKRRIIFSTYQSVPVIAAAIKVSTLSAFDIVFYDEAHRTAGVSGSNLFAMAIQDSEIPSKSRLFMTATERVVKPRIREAADELNRIVFSMDDEARYGKTLHRLSFGDAIEQGIVSDYRIVFAGITKSELNALIKTNRYVAPESFNGKDYEVDAAQSVYRRVLLKRCFEELGLKKVITFHSKVAEAKLFATQISDDLASALSGSVSVSHINGTMSSSERSEYIKQFELSNFGVLTNVRCLTEGIDIPLIDGVFFADPKGSLIDIVQAVGRALRQPFGSKGKIAYIIIPVLIDEQSDQQLTGDSFDALFNVIQALRDQDETLAEWIDHINLGAVTGRKHRGQSIGKLKVMLPPSFDIDALESSLLLKIAEVNRDPSGHVGIGSKLGKHERKSSYTRVYKTLCDYTPEKLNAGLVVPTLALITDLTGDLQGSSIRVNNNNVSHCERLGVIKKLNSKTYRMTPLGTQLKQGKIKFMDLFMNQMLLFSYDTGKGKFFPYREAFKFMRDVRELGFVDFVYGIYSLQVDPEKGVLLQDAIDCAKYIQAHFPNIEITSESNKQQVLESLNELHPTGFPYNDVWTDRTTTGNQYRYLIRHLELFNEIFEFRNKRLFLASKGKELVDKYLNLTEPMLNESQYGTIWWLNNRLTK
jgi:superfamily II DNA or RNA helicase